MIGLRTPQAWHIDDFTLYLNLITTLKTLRQALVLVQYLISQLKCFVTYFQKECLQLTFIIAIIKIKTTITLLPMESLPDLTIFYQNKSILMENFLSLYPVKTCTQKWYKNCFKGGKYGLSRSERFGFKFQ